MKAQKEGRSAGPSTPFLRRHGFAWGFLISGMVHVGVVSFLPKMGGEGALVEVEIEEANPDPQPNAREDFGLGGKASKLSPTTPTKQGGSKAGDNLYRKNPEQGEGDGGSPEAIQLVAEIAPITLVSTPTNALDLFQVQRIHTSSESASYENRRATPNPQNDFFLASGQGESEARLPPSASKGDARAWSLRARDFRMQHSSHQSSPPSSNNKEEGFQENNPALSESVLKRSFGGAQGEPQSRRSGGHRGAPAHGRPPLDRGPAATLSETTGRPQDSVDAELLAASLVESAIDASLRRGRGAGTRGGEEIGKGEGSGQGRGEGGWAEALFAGEGMGAWGAQRPVSWLLAQKQKIEERLVFPRPRQLARDQGTAVVVLVVKRDGSLLRPPRIIRSSGFADLDEAALRAIRESLPFEPIPSEWLPGRATLALTIPIRFSNPLVE
ncbi:MAG: energy transducer TonB [Sandaracinaceae bacterium]|nr:energy transducer TonB [Sandaracinaceae bacterium]